MKIKAFQDYYPDHLSHCYGCGKLNEQGYQIKTVWDGDETLTTFAPKPYHTAVPGFVYGGLLASLIDCHGTGSAAAAMYKQEGRDMDSKPSFRFLTGSLNVKYLKPTPIDCTLEIRGTIREIKGKKVTVDVNVIANGETTVTGEVVTIQVPDKYIKGIIESAEKQNSLSK
jgi:acyl-coenzyme A thioesterase PaaI-like protein